MAPLQHQQQLSYWAAQLDGSQPAEIINDRPRPTDLSGETGREEIAITASRSRRLHEYCSVRQATPGAVLLGAFRATHFRLTGTEDATISASVATQRSPAVWRHIRSTVHDDESFEDLVRQVQNTITTACENQDVTFDAVVAELNRNSTERSGIPLARIAFTVHDRTQDEITDPAQRPIKVTSPQSRNPQFDIEFNLVHQDSGLRGHVLYTKDLFYRETITSMIAVFSEILRRCLDEPHLPIVSLDLSEVPVTQESYKRSLIRRTGYPRESSIVDIFHQQAAAARETVAVIDNNSQLTYAQLVQKSDQLARWLHRRDLSPETLVAVYAPRSCLTVVAFLAILKAGLAYVPLDVNAPPDRIETIMSSIDGHTLILCGDETPRWTGETPDDVECVALANALQDADNDAQSLRAISTGPSPTSLAYVMFTSGSTGKPKGVMIEHRGIVRLAKQADVASRLRPGDRVAHITSITFDLATWEIYTAILNGGTLVCIDLMTILDATQFSARFKQEDIRLAVLTPALLQQCLDETPDMFSATNVLISAGEPLRPRLARRVLAATNAALINAYGPTEDTGYSTWYNVGRNDVLTATTPIGKSVDDSGAVVMDNQQRVVPDGVLGELVLYGDGLARGYVQIEQNKGRFGMLSIGGQSIRTYRTGDHVRRRPNDGLIEFFGRMDHQIKIRGHRVELGEIEHALLSHEKVSEAIALVQDPDTDPRLVAFVTFRVDSPMGSPTRAKAADPEDQGAEQLRAFLQQRLPKYMVPSAIGVLEKMPINANRKVDRRALAAIKLDAGRGSTDRVAPRDDTERALCEEFAAVLGTAEIGATDSFFDLGGHSLMATRAVSRINQRLATNITIKDIFECPIVRELSDRVRPSQGLVPYQPIPKLQHGEGAVEQSFAQGRLWFMDQLYPNSTRFLWQYTWDLRGTLDLSALEAALNAIEQRHETLRTTFADREGTGVQIVRPFRARKLKVVDVDNAEELADVLAQEQGRPFDLRTESGWRSAVVRSNPEHHVLSVVMHHIIQDGWSMDIIRTELQGLYSAALHGQYLLTQLPPLPIQYRDFSVWQKEPAQIAEQEQQLKYWKKQLEGSQPAELICDHPRPAVLSGEAGQEPVAIEGKLCHDLLEFCRTQRVTAFAALMSAFRATHFRMTGVDDATIGYPIANRNRQELEGLVGFFVNTQCIRSTVNDDSFQSLVQQVQSTAVTAFENQDVPFERIVAELKLSNRDASRNPLVQLSFVVHAQQDFGRFTLEGLHIETPDAAQKTRFDIEFHLSQEETGFRGYVLYAKELFEEATIKNMVSIFYEVLRQGLENPQIPVARLPLTGCLSPSRSAEQIRIKHTEYPRDSSIVDVFRQQVAVIPDVVAVKDDSSQLTYAELDRQSDKLSRWLRAQKLADESLVGVYMPRSCQTIVVFLGILKANLAYLPLDIKAPSGRIEIILSSVSSDRLLVLEGETPMSVAEGDHIHTIRLADALKEPVPDKVSEGSTPTATSLAYVMFTSGSTGRPKGVMIEHRGAIRLAKQPEIASMPPGTGVAHLATIAFDASTWEIYMALLNGGTLVCIDVMTVLDTAKLKAQFINDKVRYTKLTPVLLRQCLEQGPETLRGLDVLLTSGDRLHPHVAQQARRYAGGRFFNAYGPTESTGHSTCFNIPGSVASELLSTVPIGQAIGNSGAIVADAQQRLVPLGIIGELLLTGDGLARGYLDPKQNQNRFVELNLDGEITRAYRTGDYVRRRPVDGEIDFIGRIDHQVKIRGYRVELGEIEHALLRNEAVSDAVVLVQDEGKGDPRVIAFVTLRPEQPPPAAVTDKADESDKAVSTDKAEDKEDDEAEEVKAWAAIRQNVVYADLKSIDIKKIGRDFVGWVSMYDQKEINKDDMEEWLQDSMRTIKDGRGPERVLEVGTGTGMILFNLVDNLQTYHGLEPVEHAVNFVMSVAKSNPEFTDMIKVHVGSAGDVDSVRGIAKPTMAIVNSVAQYFPSPEYLHKVIADFFRLGTCYYLYFGDIRSYAIYRQFQVTMSRYRIGARPGKAQLRRCMEQIEQAEKELLVDPAFFTALQDQYPELIEHVEIIPKRMKATNELSCYRYAAVVHIKHADKPPRPVHRVGDDLWTDFTAARMDGPALLDHLHAKSASGTPTVAVSNIPFSKTISERSVVEALDADVTSEAWVAALDVSADRVRHSLCPKDVADLAEQAGFEVEMSWARQSSQRGGFDAIFHHIPKDADGRRVLFNFPTEHRDRLASTLANRPLQFRHHRKMEQVIHRALQSELPNYMVPSVLRVLEQMPVNDNRKVDRQALAKMTVGQEATRSAAEYVGPRTDTERALCEEYSAILGVDVGVADSFFDLGGHSLMATRAVSRINKRLAIELTIKDIFDCPIVEQLAHRAEPLVGSTQYVAIPQLEHTGPVEQSFAQGRLWFLDQLYPNSTRYIVPYRLRLGGPLNLIALESAANALQSRHETLRTVFADQDGVGVQNVQPFQPKALKVIEVSPEDKSNLTEILEKEQIRPFDLRTEPGFRVAVFKVGENDHVLSIVLHHIISDGWSMDIIRTELGQFYAAALHGREAEISPLPIQYRDFAVWQKQPEQAQQQEKQLKYWTQQLGGSQAAEIPCDLPRPTVLSGEAKTVDAVISGPLFDQVQNFCRVQKTTPFATLLSAFRATHFRLTGVEDATVGSLVANRNRQELESLVGFFVNLQAIRSVIQEEDSFSDLVSQTKTTITSAFKNQDVPFERIVADLKLASRDVSRNPLVQVTFALHAQQGAGKFNLEALEVESMTRSRRTRFDIEFHLYQEESSFRGYVLYAKDLFRAETVQNLVSVFYEVLRQAVAEPDAPISSLPLTGESSLLRDAQASQLQIRRTDYPRDSSISDVFRQQVAICPDTVAVKDNVSKLTYAELDRASDRLSQWLLATQNLSPESLVGVYMPRSCNTVVAFLAILKSNLAYLPLDVNAPAGRIEAILSSVSARRVLVLEDEVPVPAPASSVENVRIVKITDALDAEPPLSSQTPSSAPSATSLAYVKFTSGSTGKPKGVMIEHRGVVRLARQSEMTSRIGVGTAVAHVATIAFDASTWEIYNAILNGGTLVCVDFMTVLEPERLAERFVEDGVRVAKLTPVLLQQSLERAPRGFEDLDVLISAGDKLHPSLARQALKVLEKKGGELFNAYGPTENSGFSTCYRVPRNESFAGVVPIGQAIENSGALVVDAKRRVVPDGVLGELVVTGDGLARGYLDTRQDHDRFIEVAVDDKAVRAYRTGDYVRRRPVDGQLEFFGRIDHQVKIRGYRVELGEVENAILGHSTVSEAVALIKGDGDNVRLATFVTLRSDSGSAVPDGVNHKEWATEQLHDYLRTRLPSYMLPSSIQALDSMPVNQNRKVDRRALSQLADASPSSQTTSRRAKKHIAPRNDIEKAICDEFAAILSVDVGATDSFFDLGGHSLIATRVVSRINKRHLGRRLGIFEFYQTATPETLAALLTSTTRELSDVAAPSYMHQQTRPGNKATLVLVHGFWGQGNVFLPLLPLLESSFDIVLVHDPFFGTPEAPSSLRAWAQRYLDDLARILQRTDMPVVLGGFSLGGLIAFEMASLWGKKFENTELASVLLLDAGGYPSLEKYFAEPEIPTSSLEHALHIFGDDGRDLAVQHFEKHRGISFGGIDEFVYGGDGLYLVTPESSSADWWAAHVPNAEVKPVECAHYEVLGAEMVRNVAELVKGHYRGLVEGGR